MMVFLQCNMACMVLEQTDSLINYSLGALLSSFYRWISLLRVTNCTQHNTHRRKKTQEKIWKVSTRKQASWAGHAATWRAIVSYTVHPSWKLWTAIFHPLPFYCVQWWTQFGTMRLGIHPTSIKEGAIWNAKRENIRRKIHRCNEGRVTHYKNSPIWNVVLF